MEARRLVQRQRASLVTKPARARSRAGRAAHVLAVVFSDRERQRKLDDFFVLKRGETEALTGNNDSQIDAGMKCDKDLIPSGHSGKVIRSIRKQWEAVKIVTFNVESLRGNRTQELIAAQEQRKVDIGIWVGTRSNYNGDSNVGEFKLFHEANGNGGTEWMTGLVISIRKSLLVRQSIVKKWTAMEGRILLVRIKNIAIDVTICAAYAPGDHLSRELRGRFWDNLRKAFRELPNRTTKVVGIDANGHTGRDGIGGIGKNGQERWTNNGHELEKMVNEGRI